MNLLLNKRNQWRSHFLLFWRWNKVRSCLPELNSHKAGVNPNGLTTKLGIGVCGGCVCVRAHARMLRHVWLFVTLWKSTARLFCPCYSPGKNSGVGCHLLQEILWPRDRTHVSYIAGRFFTTEPSEKHTLKIEVYMTKKSIILAGMGRLEKASLRKWIALLFYLESL